MKPAIISPTARAAMIAARGTPEHRSIVSKLFTEARAHYGIYYKHKLRCELDDSASPVYLMLIRKKTGERYMRDERLIPAYPLPAPPAEVILSFNYTRVKPAEALAMLQSMAGIFGTETALPQEPPAWAGTWAVGGKLVVPVGSKAYSMSFENALAALTIYGEPISLNTPPQGHGGALADSSYLYLPA